MTRAISLLIACVLSVAHPVPPRVVYHCLVTGARNLPECCCRGKSSCCQKPTVSTAADCCYRRSASSCGVRRGQRPAAPPSAPTVASPGCGCCDVGFQAGTSPVVAVKGDNEELRRLREGAPFLVLPLDRQDGHFLPVSSEATVERWPRAPPLRPGRLYLLFCSFLL